MNSIFAKFQKLKPIWDSLGPKRRRQLLGLQILSLISAAGEVANLGALFPVLGFLANPAEGVMALGPLAAPLGSLPAQHLLLIFGLAFLLVVVTSTSIRVITIRSQMRLAALIAADLGDQVFQAVLHRPYSWHLENNSSQVLGYLTKDVDQVGNSIRAVLALVVNLAIVLLLGISLIAAAPGVMLLNSALLAGYYLLVFRVTQGMLYNNGQRLTTNYQASLQVAQEGLGGIRDVLIDRSQPFFLDAYRSRNRIYRLAIATIAITQQVPRYLIEGFALVIIVGLALTSVLQGHGIEQQLPLMGTLALGAYRLLQPLQQCFSSLSSLQANQASLQRLKPFLGKRQVFQKSTLDTLPKIPSPMGIKPLLQLQDVNFRYGPESPWILSQLNLTIQQGESIAFVGSTGSGKTTTSDLILGLLKPTEGRLLIDGNDLHGNPSLVEAWQQRVAHVPQSIYLSDSSFAENIAFGLPSELIDIPRVQLAAKQARIAEVIQSSSDGYSTIVGERGLKLSGGQRQRIGLARALYKQAELLVLDEATSALDNRTEAEVIEAIESMDHQITVIMIAHRLSTVQRCDRILLLEQGRIAGLGSYEELISSNAQFRQLAHEFTSSNS